MQKLSVVIPAYNEAGRILNTLKDVAGFLAKKPYDYEIIIVDDGSRDNTVSVVSEFAKQNPKVQVLQNQENFGKGFVVKQGMLFASGDLRVFMDADNSTKIEEIEKFIPYFEKGVDVLVGSRRIQGANIATPQGFLRDFLGGVFRLIVHTLVPVSVKDSQCGFKAFSKNAAKSIFSKQTIYRWAFDVEILALAKKMKFFVKELPITWVNDGNSHVKFSGMVKMLFEVVQIRLNLWTGKY